MNGLIGYTGFIGSNLVKQFKGEFPLNPRGFDKLYNSKNIQEIEGQAFDLLVCAGAPGVKWKANQDPLTDLCNLVELADHINKTQITRLVLISTVDVFDQKNGDEDNFPDSKEGYGANRAWLEHVLSKEFETNIVRLPAMFGSGLRKNALYDLMHKQRLNSIGASDTYQWYNVEKLWADIEIVVRENIGAIQLVTEPIRMSDIIHECFPQYISLDFMKAVSSYYNFHTRFGRLFGGGQYISDKATILRDIKKYVETCDIEHH